MQELDAVADDVGVCDAGGEHAGDEVGEGREAVHEDPEAGEGLRAGEDAAEDEGEGEEEVRDVAARFGVLDAGDDHAREAGGEEEEGEDEEEHEGAALVDGVAGFRVAVEADGVVPCDEDEEAGEGVPGQLDDDVGEHEGAPGVGFRRPFARFVEGPLGDEVGHDLLDELAEDGEEHEDGKELVLEALETVFGAEEGEADEEPLWVC